MINVCRSVALLCLMSVGTFVNAQVYKCQENGKTVFSDQPCAADSKRVEVRPATGAFDPKARAEVYKRIDRQAQGVEDGYRMIERQQTREAPRVAVPSEPDKCDQLREKHADAKYWAGEFRHPDNIRREQEKAKKAASDSFFECGPGKRVSVFDQ